MRMRHVATVAWLGLALTACAAAPTVVDPHGVPSRAPPEDPGAAHGPLFDTVEALDSAFFDTFNRCADPAQLQAHAGVLDADLEFYHDKGGASFGSAKYLADVTSNVCGKFERRRIPGTLRVYPVPGFGAVALGVHVFCPFESGRCEGAGDFLIVWKQDGEHWHATRVISYAHRPVGRGD